MNRVMITQSLISSWNYAMSAHESVQEEAYTDFLDTLHRKEKAPSEEMLNGIEFEAEVYRQAKGDPRTPHDRWESGIRKTADVLKDAPTQIRLSRPMLLMGIDILVYGILDALKEGVIYDVKFSNKSFGSADLPGKYLDSPQHPAYFYLVPEASAFKYLVSDGTDLYTETYTRKNTRPFEEVASEFLSFLSEAGLMDTYTDHWTAK